MRWHHAHEREIPSTTVMRWSILCYNDVMLLLINIMGIPLRCKHSWQGWGDSCAGYSLYSKTCWMFHICVTCTYHRVGIKFREYHLDINSVEFKDLAIHKQMNNMYTEFIFSDINLVCIMTRKTTSIYFRTGMDYMKDVGLGVCIQPNSATLQLWLSQ